MKTSQITLYSLVTSPYTMKVHCYLLYKRLPFNVVYINPINMEKQLPIGRQVPVLSIGENAKNESAVIGLWLDSLFPSNPLLPENADQQKQVIKIDNWITDALIPVIFYSIYPKIDSSVIRQCKNTLNLGRCVSLTCETKLPTGLRFLWPIFIRRAKFIKDQVFPLIKAGSAAHCRTVILNQLEEKLSHQQYLAGTSSPSLADLSAWPLLTVPYQLGISGTEDFLNYPHLVSWTKRVKNHINSGAKIPPLIPRNLVKNNLSI